MSNFEWPYLRNGSCDPFHGSVVGFSGQRIEWCYCRFNQIQDGGRDMT